MLMSYGDLCDDLEGRGNVNVDLKTCNCLRFINIDQGLGKSDISSTCRWM